MCANCGNAGCKGCGMGGGCIMSKIGKILVIVGGINWGLVGVGMLAGGTAMSWNVVDLLLGSWPVLEAIVYVLVGVSAVMSIVGCRCKKCMAAKGTCASCGMGSMDKNMGSGMGNKM